MHWSTLHIMFAVMMIFHYYYYCYCCYCYHCYCDYYYHYYLLMVSLVKHDCSASKHTQNVQLLAGPNDLKVS